MTDNVQHVHQFEGAKKLICCGWPLMPRDRFNWWTVERERVDGPHLQCKNKTFMSYFCGVMMSRMTIEERIERSINTSAADVFLRRNFEKFGGYDQVGRALRAVIAKGRLVKAGYGVYVRARRSSLTGNAVPAVPLIQIGLAALSRLGIKAGLGSSALEYMEGNTTQMPMAAVINVGKSRISRKIGIGSRAIRYER